MGLLNFNSKNNKVYNYSGRFAKTKLKLKPKFDEFRSTLGSNNGINNKFTKAVNDYDNQTEKSVKKRLVVIIFILILVFLYIIDFDLKIFYN